MKRPENKSSARFCLCFIEWMFFFSSAFLLFDWFFYAADSKVPQALSRVMNNDSDLSILPMKRWRKIATGYTFFLLLFMPGTQLSSVSRPIIVGWSPIVDWWCYVIFFFFFSLKLSWLLSILERCIYMLNVISANEQILLRWDEVRVPRANECWGLSLSVYDCSILWRCLRVESVE